LHRFVVVEGLIGVGKTSLCRVLRDAWGARLVLEPAETNPFLEPFYDDPVRYALPVQLFYLMNRWRQQATIRQGDLFTEVVVSDYLFEKDRMFAEKTLGPEELEIYERFAGVLGPQAPRPDLVVFLDAPTPVLLERIARRAAPGEHHIGAAYLDDLRERYERLWARFAACPVLRIDNRDMNYVDDLSGRAAVLNRIEAAFAGRLDSEAPGSVVDREAWPELFGRGS
jgi:deoxyadenosine/deoxycytidine kinase